MYRDIPFESLLGNVLVKVTVDDDREEIEFLTVTGEKFLMHHRQDCCECVQVEEVIGDLEDLIGHPLVEAEVSTNTSTHPPDADHNVIEHGEGSFTWTFYRLRTCKGAVVIRWYGSSNGYYSETVDFVRLGD